MFHFASQEKPRFFLSDSAKKSPGAIFHARKGRPRGVNTRDGVNNLQDVASGRRLVNQPTPAVGWELEHTAYRFTCYGIVQGGV